MSLDLIPTIDVVVGDDTWLVFMFLYPTDPISRIVFARVAEVGKELDSGAYTAVRTTTPLGKGKREWWIAGVDATGGKLLEGVDWWPGEPHLPDKHLAARLIERRMTKGADAARRGDSRQEVTHYGERGARITHGGIVVPFIGRDS